MADSEIQVPEDLEVDVSTLEPPAQPDKAAPSTGTEQTAERDASAQPEADGETLEVEGSTDEKPEDGPKRTPWFIDRLGRQREQIAEQKRQNEELTARLAALEARQQQPEADQGQDQRKGPSQEQIQSMVRAEAARYAEANAMQQKLQSFEAAGRKDFPDFVDRCNTIASLGAADNPHFMPAITSMEDGHKVVAALAADPQKAMQILAMPPIPMAVALAKLSGQPAKPPPVSKAPPPVNPVKGQTRSEKSDDDLSDDEYWAREQKRLKG